VHDEAGAVLVLALVFLIVVGAIVGSLTTWTMNDLNNTSHFTSARSLQYAANSATEVAIQSIRYNPLLGTDQTLNASPPSYCWGNATTPALPAIDGENFAVWCSTTWNPSSSQTRVVTFSTCLVTSTETAASCAASPFLQAVVSFDDYPSGGTAEYATAPCVVYCGTNMTVISWAWSPLVPTAGSLSTTTGPITGGTSVTITGTGFVSGATTVNFVEEPGINGVSPNVILPATNVTVVSSTSITATSPAVTAGTQYYVTVTTPGGTSANVLPVFTYSLAAPTVTGFASGSLQTGSTSGGTAVTVTGSGFVTGATVTFVRVGNPSVSWPASYVTVNPATLINPAPSITAVSPAVITGDGSTYYVDVTTPGEPIAQGPVFTYSLYYPIVAGFGTGSPTSGSIMGGTVVTITGTGFVTGSTVAFGLIPATGVVVNSPTSITATSPPSIAGPVNITVTNSKGTSTGGPVFTYS
jgi:hypothetical protein